MKKSSFADHPMSALWDYERNNGMIPSNITRKSTKLYFFNHDICGHIYEYSPSKIRDDMMCLYCSKVPRFCGVESCRHCFERSFASFELNGFVWHPTFNLPIFPFMVSKGTNKAYWFWHDACAHAFEKSLDEITWNLQGCPYCAFKSGKLCGKIECIGCFDKSLASVDMKGLVWMEKENAKTLLEVTNYSHTKYWFHHPDCDHTFQLSASAILSRFSICPFCCSGGGRLCGDVNCKHCFDRSLANVVFRVLVWHPTKNIVPIHTIFPGTSRKYHFTCTRCGHDTLTEAKHAIVSIGCKYCIKGVHCGDVNCQICKNNSIMSLEMSKYLSPKNDKNVWMLPKSSGAHVLFDCPFCGHEYHTKVSTVYNGTWCNCQKNKTATKLYDFLIDSFPDKTIKKEFKQDWCVNEETGRNLPFDFGVGEYILIELDGSQHFESVNFFKSNVDNQHKRDIYKTILALQNGKRVIRLYQIDVWKDKNNWATQLKALIEDDSQQLAFVSTDNKLVTDTYAMYADNWEQFLLDTERHELK